MGDRSRGPRQRKSWHHLTGGFILLTANSTNLGSFFAPNEPATFLRLLGEYVIGPTSAPVVGDKAIVTVGIGVVSVDAATLGASAMPDPEDEPDYPWLYWASHGIHFVDASVIQWPVWGSFESRLM